MRFSFLLIALVSFSILEAQVYPRFDTGNPKQDEFYTLTFTLIHKLDSSLFSEANLAIKRLEVLTPDFEGDWNYSNALHKISIGKGRIALLEDDVLTAKKFLLRAGKVKGSPQLRTFGPNMSLAKLLLERGESEVVLQYFDLVDVFWDDIGSSLDKWRSQIENGELPDFKANMVY